MRSILHSGWNIRLPERTKRANCFCKRYKTDKLQEKTCDLSVFFVIKFSCCFIGKKRNRSFAGAVWLVIKTEVTYQSVQSFLEAMCGMFSGNLKAEKILSGIPVLPTLS